MKRHLIIICSALVLLMLGSSCAHIDKLAFWRYFQKDAAEDTRGDSGDDTAEFDLDKELERYKTTGDLLLIDSLIAHGGIDNLRNFNTVEFEVRGWPFSSRAPLTEHHTVDLFGRRVLIEGVDYKAGFDGFRAWITPDIDALGGSPRLHALNPFFFFGLPFLFADPGIQREALGVRTLNGVDYDAVRLTTEFSSATGREKEYVAYFDRESHILALTHYTVTYPGFMLGRSRQDKSQRHAAVYDQWQWVDGLLVPLRVEFYIWEDTDLVTEDGLLIGPPAMTVYNKVTFSRSEPDPADFTMPEGAVEDETESLIKE